MENILVSACLLGLDCRYDGGNTLNTDILKLKTKYNLVPICPEVFGGLSTPRDPAEITGDKVISKYGKDVTKEYEKGAREALKLAKLYNVKRAILKDRSPSCGSGLIYDGNFTGNKIEGNGVTSKLFLENNIEVIGESDISVLF